MAIRHIVMWKLQAESVEDKARDAAELATRLEALVPLIDEIQALSVENNCAYPDANYDVALIADFADVAALERYQVHPDHQAVVGFVRSVVSGRAAIDFEI